MDDFPVWVCCTVSLDLFERGWEYEVVVMVMVEDVGDDVLSW